MKILGVRDVCLLTEPERGKGYNIESKMSNGSPRYIEVKASRSRVAALELTGNEYQHILGNPGRSFVYVVANSSSDPTLYIISGIVLGGSYAGENIYLVV